MSDAGEHRAEQAAEEQPRVEKVAEAAKKSSLTRLRKALTSCLHEARCQPQLPMGPCHCQRCDVPVWLGSVLFPVHGDAHCVSDTAHVWKAWGWYSSRLPPQHICVPLAGGGRQRGHGSVEAGRSVSVQSERGCNISQRELLSSQLGQHIADYLARVVLCHVQQLRPGEDVIEVVLQHQQQLALISGEM